MKMMPSDVISHENQLQHLSEPSIFILDDFRTVDHAGQIFIPHGLCYIVHRELKIPTAPTKAKSREPAYSQACRISKTKPIGNGSDPVRQKDVRRLWHWRQSWGGHDHPRF